MTRLRILGPVHVETLQGVEENPDHPKEEQDRLEVPRFRSRRTVALLGYLAAERRPVSRDFLAPFFWPDENLSKGRACLRRELYNLGQILPDCWQMDRQIISFVPSPTTSVDLYSLLELAEQERWAEASDLLGGLFLEGLYLEENAEFELWLLSERDRWRVLAEEVLNQHVRGLIRRGHYIEALHHTRRLLKLSPWNERGHQYAMRLLAWTGQRGSALRQFNTCQSVLKEELNIEPSDETRILCRQINAGDLDLPPQLPAFLSEEKARHSFELPPFVGCEAELIQLDHYLQNALKGQNQLVFITGGPGRGKTALLENFAQQAMEENPSLLVASSRCYAHSGGGNPFLPFRDLMGMLMGDIESMWDAGSITREHAQRLWFALPIIIQTLLDYGRQLIDVIIPGEDLLSRAVNIEGPDTSWIQELREVVARNHTGPDTLIERYLYQQVTRVLFNIAREQPLLLILDDLQWADPASISLLFYLGKKLLDQDTRLLVACAYRPEEVGIQDTPSGSEPGEQDPLPKMLSEFKRCFGDIWIDLSHPKEKGGRLFVDALLDIKPNHLAEDFRQALSARTGGHPLFTVELLQAMKEQGDLLQDDNNCWINDANLDWDLFPARVEAVIEDRINRLEPNLQEILEVASIEGEEFTTQILAKSLGLPETDILRRLSHALERKHRLVKEGEELYTKQGGISRFRFRHGLFQVYLYNRLSAGERRLLHGQVAQYLEEIHKGQDEEIASRLAHHYHLADDLDKACWYYSLVADRAATIYANEEAQSQYSKAIELSGRISPTAPLLAKLHRGRGLIFNRLGEFDHALSDYKLALQIARSLGDPHLEWTSLIDLGRLWASHNYQQTRDHFEKALQIARLMDDPLMMAISMNWMGNWHLNMELPHEATSYHLEALEIVERIGNKQELANTLDLLGIQKLMEGKQKASKKYYDRAIVLQREMENHVRLVTSLTGRAGTAMIVAFLANVSTYAANQASDDLLEALQFADETGSNTGKSWALYMQGILNIVRGQFGFSRDNFLQGLKLATEANHSENKIGNHFGIGVLYLELCAPEQARVHAEKALHLAEEIHSQAMINYSVAVLAGAHLQMYDNLAAQTCLEKGLSPSTPMDTIGKRLCWIRQVELALSQGALNEALQITNRLINSTPEGKSAQVITYLWKLKANALSALDQTEKALPLLLEALENALKAGEVFLVWKLHASLSKVYRELERESEADDQLEKSQSQIQTLADTITDETLKNQFLKSTREKLISFH